MTFGRPLGTYEMNIVAKVEASLEYNEELCPECEGKGKIKVGHSFLKGNLYIDCSKCYSSGKVTREALVAQKEER